MPLWPVLAKLPGFEYFADAEWRKERIPFVSGA